MKQIPYSLFTLKALAELASRISDELKKSHPDDVIINASANRLKADVAEVKKAISGSRMQQLSDKVAVADQNRDEGYTSLRDHVAAGLKRLNGPYRAACERLWPIFLKNGTRLYILPYPEQTQAMQKLFEELSASSAQEDLRTINAQNWLQEVRQANRTFEELYESDVSEDVNTAMTDEQAEKQLKATLTVVVSTLKALEAVKDPAGIEDTIQRVNDIIDEHVESVEQDREKKWKSYQDQY